MKMWSLKSIQLKYYQLETFNLNGLFPIGWGIIDHIKLNMSSSMNSLNG